MLETQTMMFDYSKTIQEKFERFHQENPHVYDEVVTLCRQAKRAGRNRWSINGVFEVLRWSWMETQADDFKLNNVYRARYARLVMEIEPDLKDFFTTRELTA